MTKRIDLIVSHACGHFSTRTGIEPEDELINRRYAAMIDCRACVGRRVSLDPWCDPSDPINRMKKPEGLQSTPPANG